MLFQGTDNRTNSDVSESRNYPREAKMSKMKIMVAVDFSESSLKTVEYAGKLAEKLEAELIFVNVINQRDVDAVDAVSRYTDKISAKEYVESLIDERTEILNEMLQETNCTSVPHRFAIKKGVPFKELVRAAEKERVDLVIMGAKGRSNIEGIVFGSQAEKMFRHCPVPLLSIREKD